jgi:hypothetical protein
MGKQLWKGGVRGPQRRRRAQLRRVPPAIPADSTQRRDTLRNGYATVADGGWNAILGLATLGILGDVEILACR